MTEAWFDSYTAGAFAEGVPVVTPSAPDPNSADACGIRRRPTDLNGGQHRSGTAVTAATAAAVLLLPHRAMSDDEQQRHLTKVAERGGLRILAITHDPLAVLEMLSSGLVKVVLAVRSDVFRLMVETRGGRFAPASTARTMQAGDTFPAGQRRPIRLDRGGVR